MTEIKCNSCGKICEWDDDRLCEACALKEYFDEVGCKKCGKGGQWKVFADPSQEIGAFQCSVCGHIILQSDPVLKKEPDHKSHDLRMFT